MKISIVHYSSTPNAGGVERVIHAHALKFSEKGYETAVISGSGENFSPRIPVNIIPEMEPLYISNPDIHKEILEGKISPAFRKMKDRIRDKLVPLVEKSDVCLIHNVLTMHFNLALTAAFDEIIRAARGTKFISWIHDATYSDPDYKEFWREEHPWTLLKKADRRVLQVAISAHRRRKTADIFNIPKDSIKVIPDGVDPAAFLKLQPATNYLFNKLKLYSSDFIFLYPTRIVKRKNIEYAIETVSHMNKEHKKTCLLITSQPDPYNKESIVYLKKLKKLAADSGIKEKVIFLSEAKTEDGKILRVDDDILRDLYLLSDLLLFTSNSEGFGIPLLEAGICRLPIACTEIPPLKEIGGRDVIYINPEEPIEKTTGKITSYLEKTLPVPMFRKIFREYTWDAIFSKKILPLIEGKNGKNP